MATTYHAGNMSSLMEGVNLEDKFLDNPISNSATNSETITEDGDKYKDHGSGKKEQDKANDLAEESKVVTPHKIIIAQGTKIEICEDILTDIPYIDALFSSRCDADGNGVVKSDAINPSLLKVLLRYLTDHKTYKLFACLPMKEDAFELLKLFQFLSIKSPIETKVSNIKEKLMWFPSVDLGSQEQLAEYTFSLFLAKDMIAFTSESELCEVVFNALNYVLNSERTCFQARAKHHLLKIATKIVPFTYSQLELLKKLESTDVSEHFDAEYVLVEDYSDFKSSNGCEFHEMQYYNYCESSDSDNDFCCAYNYDVYVRYSDDEYW